jgi:hypothetical protein
MHTHQNFTFGMLVEEINPAKDAALYCMGGHFCHATDLQLDTGDSIETELAELGEMFSDIISSRPAPGIISFGAQNCSSCVDSGDKAVMQDVIAKVCKLCFVICVTLARNETFQQVKNFCSHTKDPRALQVLFISCSRDGVFCSCILVALLLDGGPSRIHSWLSFC